MSEASLEADLIGALDDLPANAGAGPSAATRNEVVFAGRYAIQPDVVLPHLCTVSARAYVAFDRENPTRSLYALVLDRAVPARHKAIVSAKGIVDGSILKPVRWGRVDWPASNREEIIIILPQPPGPALMPNLESEIRPWFIRELKRDLLIPLIELLKTMHDERVSHRNIRPTNLFRSGDDDSVISGQVFSAAPGLDQPALFEPLERARCLPGGRGAGDMADDLYAIGVTIMMLALGRNPVAGLDDDEIMRRRIQLGSYNALLGDNKLHNELAPVVRALMRDDDHERWSISDLSNWVQTGRVNPSQPAPVARVDRPFEFDGDKADTAVELAYLLSRKWEKAVKVIATQDIENWADRSLKNRSLAKEIAACPDPGPGGPKQMTPDIVLSRTLITLNPTGPICFRGLVVMPDGFATATASALGNAPMSQDFTGLIDGKLMSFWHEVQVRPKPWMIVAAEVAEKMSVYLARRGAGFSIERCAYELNPALPCLSPLLGGSAPLQVRELLETMEEHAEDGGFLFDRHIAAFLGARVSGSIDKELTDIADATEEASERMSQLRLLAYVQSKSSATAAPKLYDMFLKYLQPAINEYKNVPMRERLHRAARKAVSKGSLNDLVRILDNRKNRTWDERGFEAARKRNALLDREIERLRTDAKSFRRQSLLLGHQIAANIGSLVAVAAAVIVIMMRAT